MNPLPFFATVRWAAAACALVAATAAPALAQPDADTPASPAAHWRPHPGSFQETARNNKQQVDRFYAAVEAQHFNAILDLFAPRAQQLRPYAPTGFPTRLDGTEAICRQFSGLAAAFGEMRFQRRIVSTEDPNFIVVIFQGHMALKARWHLRERRGRHLQAARRKDRGVRGVVQPAADGPGFRAAALKNAVLIG